MYRLSRVTRTAAAGAAAMPPPSAPATSSSSFSSSRLNWIIDAVVKRPTLLQADDVFRVATLITSDGDSLELAAHPFFMQALKTARDAVTLKPFQAAQVAEALKKGRLFDDPTPGPISSSSAGSSAATANRAAGAPPNAPSPAAPELSPQLLVDELVIALEEEATSFRTSRNMDSARIAKRLKTAMEHTKLLNASQITSVLRSLATINLQDYAVAHKMARRANEVAPDLTLADACLCLSAAYRLNVQDSLVGIVSRIESEATRMTLKDCFYVMLALEKHQNLHTNMQSIVNHVCHICSGRINDMNIRLLSMVLDACARFGVSAHLSQGFVEAIAKRADELPDGKIFPTLQCIQHLRLLTPQVHTQLINRAAVLCPSMDLRNIEVSLDQLSLIPHDSTIFMDVLLKRLSTDAGQLTSTQIAEVLQIIASYPPAKDHPAISSLAIAAKMRLDGFARGPLAKALIALLEAGYLGEEFYQLGEVLFMQRGGLRSLDELNDWLDRLTKVTAADARMQGFVATAVHQLTPTLQRAEIDQVRARLQELGIKEAKAMAKLAQRTQQIAVDAANKKAETDAAAAAALKKKKIQDRNKPFNFKKALWDMD